MAMDPFTDTEISPDMPPESLQADPQIGQGYLFLIDHGHELNLDVLLHRHGEDSDLDVPGLNYEQRIANANIVLLEGLGWDEGLMQEMNQLADSGRMSKEAYDKYCAGDSYQERVLNAISKSGTVVSFNDIDQGDGIRGDLVRQQNLHGQFESLNMSESDKRYARAVHIFAYESFREWFMIGQIGYQIQRILAQSGADISQLRGQRIVIPLGATHIGVVDKLRIFNANVDEIRAIPEEREADMFMAEAIKMGRLDVAEMKRMLFEE